MANVLFRDLKRFVDNEQQETTHNFDRLRDKEFWIWNKEQHRKEYAITDGQCCFNHIIGLPTKDGVSKPMFDYERIVFDTLFKEDGSANNKHIWIKKATGLGITELLLRIIVYLCVKDDELSGSQIVIFTGPRIDLAIDLISRLKKLFYFKNLVTSFDTKETVAVINNVKIEAFPSHHVDSARGLSNVSFIFLDESDYFPPGQQ